MTIQASDRAALGASLWALVSGAGAFGLLLGIWIVLSASPVVTTILPLLFGLVGGAGGLQISRFDSSSAKSRHGLILVGYGTATLSICCLGAMLAAIAARPWIGESFSNIPRRADILQIGPESALHENPFDALLLRVRLEILGATRDEIATILAKAPAPKQKEVTYEHMLDVLDKAPKSGSPEHPPPPLAAPIPEIESKYSK